MELNGDYQWIPETKFKKKNEPVLSQKMTFLGRKRSKNISNY
jgi:hypothetical protein